MTVLGKIVASLLGLILAVVWLLAALVAFAVVVYLVAGAAGLLADLAARREKRPAPRW